MLNSQKLDICFHHKYMYQFTLNNTDEPIVLLRAADNGIYSSYKL